MQYANISLGYAVKDSRDKDMMKLLIEAENNMYQNKNHASILIILCYTNYSKFLWRSVMLKDLIENGFGEEEDYNCAEKILYGANIVYNLGLSPEALKLSAGFGGGMGIESVCGALTASTMVLSHKYVEKVAHESGKIKEVNQKLFRQFMEEMDSIQCGYLKNTYRRADTGCSNIIIKAAEILDRLIVE